MKSESEGNKRHIRQIIGILAIVLLTFAVYRPILPGSFLMDDARLTGSDNPLATGQLTPYSLWFQTDFTLSTFGWWIEHVAFGKNPAGYHVINIMLHVLSSILLWRLVARLKIPGAWLAGALFAIHPVSVNSVARIAELKNTLSMPFCLFSFISYLRYESSALYPALPVPGTPQPSSNKATMWYVVSLIAFVLALLAKTSVVMLPVVILLCAAWQRGRITKKDVLHTLPFFILSLGFGLMSIWFQKYQAIPTSQLPLPSTSFLQRLAGAGYVFWFYLGKSLLPFNLCIQYPRWDINAGTVAAYLPGLLIVAIFALCLQFRHSWGRHVLFGLGSFLVLLFPALGFFDAQFLTMWQVSDHLQYTALAAILALLAAALAMLPNKMIFGTIAVALLLCGSILSFQRASIFTTQDALMAATVEQNPAAWDARNDLGVSFAEKGNYSKAIHDFALTLAYDPDNAQARMNIAYALLLKGKYAEAQEQYLRVLKTNPHEPLANKMYARLLELQGKNVEADYHLRTSVLFKPDVDTYMELAALDYKTGNPRQAVAELRRALALKASPDRAKVLNNLAWILATCPDASVRNGVQAVQYAEEACHLTDFKQAGMVGTLAAAYAEAGRFSEATASAEKAVNLATATGDTQFAAANRQLLLLYRAGMPYHENSAHRQGQ